MPGIPVNMFTTSAEIHKSQNLYKNRPSSKTKGKYQREDQTKHHSSRRHIGSSHLDLSFKCTILY